MSFAIRHIFGVARLVVSFSLMAGGDDDDGVMIMLVATAKITQHI